MSRFVNTGNIGDLNKKGIRSIMKNKKHRIVIHKGIFEKGCGDMNL